MNWKLNLILGLAGLLVGCPVSQPPESKGGLTVTVSGAPAGSSPNVTVSGPNGFSKALSATATLSDLEPGAYSVTGAVLTAGEAEFDGLVTGSPASVSANQTVSVTVTYLSAREPYLFPAGLSVNAPTEVKTGGALREAILSDYLSFNPFVSSEANSLPSQISAGGLLRLDPITRDYVPYMAKSYSTSADGLTWTFVLRRGLKWSDGRPVTVDDWVSTAQLHEDAAVGSNSYDSFVFGGGKLLVTKVDALTLRIVFPTVIAAAAVTVSFDVWPDHVFGAAYRAGGASAVRNLWPKTVSPSEIVSSGAFRLKSYSAGQGAQLERNPFFGEWNRDSARESLPYLDSYNVFVGDAFTKFQSGEVDTVFPNVTQISTLETGIANGSLKAVLKKNYSEAASSTWITFNFNRSSDPEKQRLFRSDAFRQAISHLTNRARIITELFGGNAAPAYTSVYGVFKDWISTDASKFDFNPQAAKNLLATLGYTTLNSDGYLTDASGKVLEFDLETNAGNGLRAGIITIIVADAKLAGVKINPKFPPFDSVVAHLTSSGTDRPFDAILLGLSGSDERYPLSNNILRCTSTLHAYNKSGACLFTWETQLEGLYDQGAVTLDRAARIAIAKQAQNLEAQHQPFIYVASPRVSLAWRSTLKGEYPANLADSVVGTREIALTWVQP